MKKTRLRLLLSAVLILSGVLFFTPTTTFAYNVWEYADEEEMSFEEEVAVTGYQGSVGKYTHCFNHNANYADNARCGEGGSGEQLAQAEEYGPFLCGVCTKCMDSGECSLTDVLIVTGNVGNFLLGIVGSIALLLFVIGGIYWLTSGGEKNKITRGKQFITAAAVGIAITFGAVLILRTAISILTTGSPGAGPTGGIVCDGTNNGATCGNAAECYNGTCMGRCEITQIEEGLPYSCMNPDDAQENSCIINRCPGGNDNVCCLPVINYDYSNPDLGF